jgi:uncharacterized membrane protein
MEILKTSTDWAKAEVFSSSFFIVFAIVFFAASIGFLQLGKTDLAKAYIIPTLVAGVLLLIIGAGLVYNNLSRIKTFTKSYNEDAAAFVESEKARVEGTLNEYKVVFKVIPLIVVAAALVMLFLTTPIWRASMITTIAMMTVIMLVDGTANARIDDYQKQLPADTTKSD